ncbi:MAG: hypothetical protein K8L97_30695 [Anaerolineae bacterium]|nr:hypothetical protein [Anaerolineae bacterium]
MTDREYVGIHISSEKRQQLETLAQRQGYDALDDYLRALIEANAKAHGESLNLEDDEDPIEGFREGWRDVMQGNTFPVSTLWDDLEDE